MSAVVVLGTPADEVQAARVDAVVAAHRRLAALVGGERRCPGPVGLARGVYVPSRDAVDAAFDQSWGESVDAKHRKAIRWIPGAVIRFPVEGSDETVPVFITDWSPLPAACALAVHRDHPLAGGEGDLPRFTGRYVRHPLRGDLLPVWAAEWVRPDFGTGAVVVNPGHSQVDLDFARAVGLPIRFALALEEPTAEPATWPDPPIVKAGCAVGTGRPYDEAAAEYLAALAAAGYAEAVAWPAVGSTVVDDALLDAAAALAGDGLVTVVCPTRAVDEELLWLRLIAGELGLAAPVTVVTVNRATCPSPEWYPALAVAGRLDEAVAVKRQLADMVATFVADHAAVADHLRGPELDGADAGVVDRLKAGDFAAAFTAAYRTSRAAARGQAVPPEDGLAYLVTAHVLFDLA